MIRSGRWMASLIAVVALSSTAYGHSAPVPAAREIVRLQGYRTTDAVAKTQRKLVLMTLGVEQPFAATDWQVFRMAPSPTEEEDSATTLRLSLQGSRDVLTRFSAAKRNQLVTILAEHRPGSSDLFLLTLDLCPP